MGDLAAIGSHCQLARPTMISHDVAPNASANSVRGPGFDLGFPTPSGRGEVTAAVARDRFIEVVRDPHQH
jgi:hypothetical protein